MKADWKYNLKELIRNVVIATVITTGLASFLSKKKKH
jgi:hypothetical protein